MHRFCLLLSTMRVNMQVHADEGQIIVGLSRTLRNEVVLHLYSEALARVPFFRNKDPNFITSVVMCFKLEYYAPVRGQTEQGAAPLASSMATGQYGRTCHRCASGTFLCNFTKT
jgi:hypothetical protein